MKMGQFEKRFVNSARHSGHVAERAERRLRSTDPEPGQRLLDVGCGNGAVAIRAARAFGLISVGVDLDPEQIEAARLAADGLQGVSFLVADATALPFPDGEFDLVYSNKTTHHIADWPGALAEMARVLKPGGKLVYADFVAPFGHRLPTRPGIDSTAAAHGLERQHAARTLVHYSASYRATDRTDQPLVPVSRA